MKVTRRALARFAAAASAVVAKAQAQTPVPAVPGRTESTPAARQLAQVKLPRTTEPATRFEA